METHLNRLKKIAQKMSISSTMHEPESSILEAVGHILPLILESGLQWSISATDATRGDPLNPSELYRIISSKVNAITESDRRLTGVNKIEANHINSLKLGLESTDTPLLFYIDSDRFSVGLAYYPDETIEMLEKACEKETDKKVVIVGRSPKAINTHHIPLIITERIIHHYYSRYLPFNEGLTDVAGTVNVFSREVLENLLRGYDGGKALEIPCSFPQPKLQLIAKLQGATLDYFSVDNPLRYEAPEQMRGSKRIGTNNHSWTPECFERVTLDSMVEQARLELKPQEWKLRFNTVREYLNVLMHYGMQLGFDFEDGRMDKTIKELDIILNEDLTAEVYKRKALALNELLA